MAVKTRAQISMDDRRVDNTELEQLLEERQELKKNVGEYKSADKKAKKMIASLNEPLPYRIGRFIISEAVIPAKSVSFDTDAGKRINIKTADE